METPAGFPRRRRHPPDNHPSRAIDLQNIICSEINKIQMDKYCIIPVLYAVPGIGKYTETETRIEITRGCREERRGSCYVTGMEFSLKMMKKFWVEVVVTQYCECN